MMMSAAGEVCRAYCRDFAALRGLAWRRALAGLGEPANRRVACPRGRHAGSVGVAGPALLTPGQLETLALNSFDAAFIDDRRRQAWKQQVRAAFAPRTQNA